MKSTCKMIKASNYVNTYLIFCLCYLFDWSSCVAKSVQSCLQHYSKASGAQVKEQLAGKAQVLVAQAHLERRHVVYLWKICLQIFTFWWNSVRIASLVTLKTKVLVLQLLVLLVGCFWPLKKQNAAVWILLQQADLLCLLFDKPCLVVQFIILLFWYFFGWWQKGYWCCWSSSTWLWYLRSRAWACFAFSLCERGDFWRSLEQET